MKLYKINELFYSLQGEGRETGRASFFVRFSGCNRACPFCDTDYTRYELLSLDQIATCVERLIPKGTLTDPAWQFVLTGGEPSLQVDYAFISALRERFGEERIFQIETNGARLQRLLDALTGNIRLTVSPKSIDDARSVLSFLVKSKKRNRYPLHDFGKDEIKIVPAALDDDARDAILLEYAEKTPEEIALYIQPCDYWDAGRNAEETKRCIEYVRSNPRWKLSTQTQKILKIR